MSDGFVWMGSATVKALAKRMDGAARDVRRHETEMQMHQNCYGNERPMKRA